MAETFQQERTEAPTPKRREEAREKGQVVKSREVVSTYLAVDPQIAQRLIGELTKRVEHFSLRQHHTPILLTSPVVRSHLKRLTEAVLPLFVVLSQSEVISNVSIKNLGVVRI
jgi:flagellar biosynthesis protein FlhA